jgi:hypothetical protein
LALLAGLAGGGCSAQDTYLQLEFRGTVPGIVRIDVSLRRGAVSRAYALSRPGAAAIALPTYAVFEVGDGAGDLTVDARAIGENDRLLKRVEVGPLPTLPRQTTTVLVDFGSDGGMDGGQGVADGGREMPGQDGGVDLATDKASSTDVPGQCVLHRFDAIDSVSLNYKGMIPAFPPDDLLKAWSTGMTGVTATMGHDDFVGWVKFDVAAAPGRLRVTSVILNLLLESRSGDPASLFLRHVVNDGWSRQAATVAMLPATNVASGVLGAAVTGWNRFEVAARDWAAEVNDGLLTLGIDNNAIGESLAQFHGADAAERRPYLEMVFCP